MLGTLNDLQIDHLLHSEVVGRIGCHLDGKTYIVPITYAYDGKNIYCHTTEGLKTKIMQTNNQVCFQVDQISNLANWRSAILWGAYEELKGQQAEDAWLSISNRVHPFTTSETSMPKYGLDRAHQPSTSGKPILVFRIVVSQKTGRFEKS